MAQHEKKVIYDYADQFIDLANELAKTDRSGAIGVALRYAAARYCAYEASMRTNNLEEEKDQQLQEFVQAFTEMLQVNLDDYSSIQASKK